MTEAEEGVGADLTPPSFLQRRTEGETTEEQTLGFIEEKKAEIAEELRVPTLEELIAVIKEKVRQRDAIDENIRVLNAHAEKMLKALSKPKK